MSTLAEIVKAAGSAARQRRVVLPVPLSGHPVTLLCRTLETDDMSRARSLGKRLSPKSEVRASLIMSKELLASACIEIWVNGETWVGDDGDPLTFDDDALYSLLGVADRLDSVAAAVGRDGDLEVMSDELIRESGFTREGYVLPEADPTT